VRNLRQLRREIRRINPLKNMLLREGRKLQIRVFFSWWVFIGIPKTYL